MKKLLTLFLFALMSLAALAQAPNDWRMPTTTLNLTGNNSATVVTRLVNDYIQGCCTNCVYNPPTSQTYTLTFTRTSGSVNPDITVTTSNSTEHVVWSGSVGTFANYITSNGITYSSTGGCTSGNVTGLGGTITIKASASSGASYSVTLTGMNSSASFFGTGTSSATSTTLNVTP